MALYAIGDLHLSFQTEVRAPMQKRGRVWADHESKFRKNCEKLIRPEDTLLLLGDHSWGRRLSECEEDLRYIEDLPGRKILLRGNHDMFWDVKKTQKLNDLYAGRLNFLQNNFFAYEDYALVGTKGITFEGPFYVDQKTGRIVAYEREAKEHADRLAEREMRRLRESFGQARAAGYRKFIMCLHFPPTNLLETDSCFTRIAEEYGAEQVLYAHSHGKARFQDSIHGMHHGVRYSLVSGDYLRWMPMRVL